MSFQKHITMKATRFYALLALLMVFAVSCNKPDEPNNGGNNNSGNGENSLNDHEYVDLGLPSGTLWATCNVGADTPNDFGNYFAWGETQPKATYSWNTYKYCMSSSDNLTKYCYDSNYGNNGFKDFLLVLKAEDDAATANWGSGWCIPTNEQWIELYQNTTQTNSTNGVFFTASNGKSLFLPAAGGRRDDELNYADHGCLYWSSSIGLDKPYNAEHYDTYLVNYTTNYGGGRFFGRSVRPVRSIE